MDWSALFMILGLSVVCSLFFLPLLPMYDAWQEAKRERIELERKRMERERRNTEAMERYNRLH